MAGSLCVGLLLVVWVLFSHAVPQWRNLLQHSQPLMFQQPVEQAASPQFPQWIKQPVQQQVSKPLPQPVEQQASQQRHQWVKKPDQQTGQNISEWFKQPVKQQAVKQIPKWVKMPVEQQASQQHRQWVKQAGKQFPQWVKQPYQQAGQQVPQWVKEPDQQAGQQFPEWVKQPDQQAGQQFPQWVKQPDQQAGQQFPQWVKQPYQQAAQQVPEWVKQPDQQAGQQIPQWVKQTVEERTGEQHPQLVKRLDQQAGKQIPQWVVHRDQQGGQQIPHWVKQPVEEQAGQQIPERVKQPVEEQAGRQIPQWVKQPDQQAGQQIPQWVKEPDQQAGQQFPQWVKQPDQQAGQQFPQWVKEPDQQAGKLFPQWVKQPDQQAGQQFPQWVKQPVEQQVGQHLSWKFQPKQPVLEPVPLDKCDVADNEQIQCGPPGISGAECDSINCCFNKQQCYYGKAVTVQCVRDGQFVVVVARDVTLPRLSLDSVHLLGGNDPPCSPVESTASFAIYQFPVTACGTSVMEESGYVVYENRMTSSYEVAVGPLGSITRDSHFELLFQCRYSDTSMESLVVEVNTVPPPPPVVSPGPLRVELRLANGQCVTKGCAEGEEAYTSYYSDADYPVTKVLREPVYVEVRVLERTDPNIVLMLRRCWATSTPSPLSLPQWDLLVDGCPSQDDNYMTTLISMTGSSGLQFPNHYKRFVVKMFTFVDPASLAPLQETLFIHCSTAVCHHSSGSCERRCARKRRGTNIKTISRGKTVVSSGEVNHVM